MSSSSYGGWGFHTSATSDSPDNLLWPGSDSSSNSESQEDDTNDVLTDVSEDMSSENESDASNSSSHDTRSETASQGSMFSEPSPSPEPRPRADTNHLDNIPDQLTQALRSIIEGAVSRGTAVPVILESSVLNAPITHQRITQPEVLERLVDGMSTASSRDNESNSLRDPQIRVPNQTSIFASRNSLQSRHAILINEELLMTLLVKALQPSTAQLSAFGLREIMNSDRKDNADDIETKDEVPADSMEACIPKINSCLDELDAIRKQESSDLLKDKKIFERRLARYLQRVLSKFHCLLRSDAYSDTVRNNIGTLWRKTFHNYMEPLFEVANFTTMPLSQLMAGLFYLPPVIWKDIFRLASKKITCSVSPERYDDVADMFHFASPLAVLNQMCSNKAPISTESNERQKLSSRLLPYLKNYRLFLDWVHENQFFQDNFETMLLTGYLGAQFVLEFLRPHDHAELKSLVEFCQGLLRDITTKFLKASLEGQIRGSTTTPFNLQRFFRSTYCQDGFLALRDALHAASKPKLMNSMVMFYAWDDPYVTSEQAWVGYTPWVLTFMKPHFPIGSLTFQEWLTQSFFTRISFRPNISETKKLFWKHVDQLMCRMTQFQLLHTNADITDALQRIFQCQSIFTDVNIPPRFAAFLYSPECLCIPDSVSTGFPTSKLSSCHRTNQDASIEALEPLVDILWNSAKESSFFEIWNTPLAKRMFQMHPLLGLGLLAKAFTASLSPPQASFERAVHLIVNVYWRELPVESLPTLSSLIWFTVAWWNELEAQTQELHDGMASKVTRPQARFLSTIADAFADFWTSDQRSLKEVYAMTPDQDTAFAMMFQAPHRNDSSMAIYRNTCAFTHVIPRRLVLTSNFKPMAYFLPRSAWDHFRFDYTQDAIDAHIPIHVVVMALTLSARVIQVDHFLPKRLLTWETFLEVIQVLMKDNRLALVKGLWIALTQQHENILPTLFSNVFYWACDEVVAYQRGTNPTQTLDIPSLRNFFTFLFTNYQTPLEARLRYLYQRTGITGLLLMPNLDKKFQVANVPSPLLGLTMESFFQACEPCASRMEFITACCDIANRYYRGIYVTEILPRRPIDDIALFGSNWKAAYKALSILWRLYPTKPQDPCSSFSVLAPAIQTGIEYARVSMISLRTAAQSNTGVRLWNMGLPGIGIACTLFHDATLTSLPCPWLDSFLSSLHDLVPQGMASCLFSTYDVPGTWDSFETPEAWGGTVFPTWRAALEVMPFLFPYMEGILRRILQASPALKLPSRRSLFQYMFANRFTSLEDLLAAELGNYEAQTSSPIAQPFSGMSELDILDSLMETTPHQSHLHAVLHAMVGPISRDFLEDPAFGVLQSSSFGKDTWELTSPMDAIALQRLLKSSYPRCPVTRSNLRPSVVAKSPFLKTFFVNLRRFLVQYAKTQATIEPQASQDMTTHANVQATKHWKVSILDTYPTVH